MNDGVNGRMLLKNCLHGTGVAQVCLDKGDLPPRDPLHPAHRLPAGIHQIVGHHHIIAGLYQFHAGVAAHITGAAAYQNRHLSRPF